MSNTAAYLATLPTGTQTITFDMISGTDPAITITVSESEVGTTTPELWANPFSDVNAGVTQHLCREAGDYDEADHAERGFCGIHRAK